MQSAPPALPQIACDTVNIIFTLGQAVEASRIFLLGALIYQNYAPIRSIAYVVGGHHSLSHF
jgi:hypothetical protein